MQVRKPLCQLNIFLCLTTQTLGHIFGISKIFWLRLFSVLRQRFCCCWFIGYCCSHLCVVVSSVIVLLFRIYFLLVLVSSWWGRESWLLYFNCHPDALWQLVFCGSSSRGRGLGMIYSFLFTDHTHSLLFRCTWVLLSASYWCQCEGSSHSFMFGYVAHWWDPFSCVSTTVVFLVVKYNV